MKYRKLSTVRKLARTLVTILFAAGLSVPVTNAANDLPELGTIAASSLTIDQEIVLGDAYMRVVRGQLPLIADPLMTEYLNDLGNRLVAHSDNVRTPFHFFLVNNEEINAFAFFGGHVGVHTGLFHKADTESELASVLAHEIAHVTQRHLARSIAAQKKRGPATLAGVLGSVLLTLAAPQAGIAALQTTVALSRQGQINYTRLHEHEADRIGMQALVAAGFDPNGAPDFFSKLAAQYRYSTKPPAILLTHPLPESRIADTRARAASYPHRHYGSSLMFQLAKARTFARFSKLTAAQLEDRFKQQLEDTTSELVDAAKYGLALTYLKQKRVQESAKLIAELRKKQPENLFYIDTHTDLLLATKQYANAITMLESARRSRPGNGVIELNLANSYLAAEQPDKARRLLERYRVNRKDDLAAHYLLAESYRKLGMKAEQHQIQAETMALRADFARAIDQLQHAYRLSRSHPLQLARIDARIKQLREAEQQKKKL